MGRAPGLVLQELDAAGEYGGGVAGYAMHDSKYIDIYSLQRLHGPGVLLRYRRGTHAACERGQAEARLQLRQGASAAPVPGKSTAASARSNFGREVFTAGFADPNLWSNHAWATDVGLNWYLNFYTKLYLDWQHSEFGSPVVIGPDRFGPTRDLFWVGSRSSSEQEFRISLVPQSDRVAVDRDRSPQRCGHGGRGDLVLGRVDQRRGRAQGDEQAELGLVVAEQGLDHVHPGTGDADSGCSGPRWDGPGSGGSAPRPRGNPSSAEASSLAGDLDLLAGSQGVGASRDDLPPDLVDHGNAPGVRLADAGEAPAAGARGCRPRDSGASRTPGRRSRSGHRNGPGAGGRHCSPRRRLRRCSPARRWEARDGPAPRGTGPRPARPPQSARPGRAGSGGRTSIRSRLGVSSAIRFSGFSVPPSGRSRTVGSRLSRLASRAALTATPSSARWIAARWSFHSAWARLASDVRCGTGDREIGDRHRQIVDLVLGEPLHLEDLLVGQQFEMQQRHVEQDLVIGGQGREAGPDHVLVGGQGFEPGLGDARRGY